MSSIDCILPESVGRLSAIFAGGGRISILAHTHPDGDALGSTGALVSYLKEKRGADALATKIEGVMTNFFKCECIGKIAFNTANNKSFAAGNADLMAQAEAIGKKF